jgi:hypothetical protein
MPVQLTAALGARHVVREEEPAGDPLDEAGTLMWMRDFAPIFVKAEDGTVEALTYLHDNRARTEFHHVLGEGMWVPSGADRGHILLHRRLPLLHQNGNLVSTGLFTFVAETVFHDNRLELASDRLIAEGYRARGDEEVLALLRGALHLWKAPDRLVVLPPLPGEATGHIDTYVLAVGEREVMVPELRAEARQLGAEGFLRGWLDDVASFLDQQAAEIARRGVRVTRLPMVSPRLAVAGIEGGDAEVVYFTPANSLLTTGTGHALAFLPTFAASELLSTEERQLELEYEEEWAKLLASRGFTPQTVEAAELAEYLGVLRCVTAVVPDLAVGPTAHSPFEVTP